MATVSRTLTYEEWLQLPPVEDGTDEVVKGELHFMPPTRYPHAEVIRRLNLLLIRQFDENEVSVFDSNFGLMISREPLTCRSPDVAVYWKNAILIKDGMFCSPPGLLVEVLSPSENRRRQDGKLEDYASIGVPEVWLVSPEAHSVEVQKLSAGKMERAAIHVEGSLEPSQFPGVSISVPALFPE